jgi:hypothetical protein
VASPLAIQRADPRVRRRALAIVAVGTVVGALVIWGSGELGQHVRDLAERDRAAAVQIARWVLWLGGAALLLPLFAFSAWLWRFAAQVHAAGRFPPPGATPVRDVRVLEGRLARIYARVTQLLALGLVACGIALFDILLRLIACLERSNPGM